MCCLIGEWEALRLRLDKGDRGVLCCFACILRRDWSVSEGLFLFGDSTGMVYINYTSNSSLDRQRDLLLC